MKKLIITGPLGHIGSKLIRSFYPGDFDEIILIDNLSTQRYASLFNLPKKINYHFIEDDICTCDLEKYFRDTNIVIHLAAITNAEATFGREKEVEKINYKGTIKVARACQKTRAKLIFISSTSVYGTQKELVDENCGTEDLKPQSPYAESKLKAENFLKKMARNSDFKFIIFRFGTIFGVSPGMRLHTVVNKFCWQAFANKPLTIWKTALHQKRPYLDLDDAIRAFHFAIKKNLFDNEIYNVLTLNTTINRIIKIIKKYDKKIQVEFVNSPIMNQLSYEVSNEKIKSLGFKFKGDIDQGIKDTLKLFKNNF